MKIRIGQVFRVPASRQASEPGDFYALCKGAHDTGVNVNRGVFYYRALQDPDGVTRIPAFLLYSDNLRGISDKNPWLDVVDADSGYALYHGDNRTPGTDPSSADGNRRILEVAHQYTDAESRALAPPLLLFESAKVDGGRRELSEIRRLWSASRAAHSVTEVEKRYVFESCSRIGPL